MNKGSVFLLLLNLKFPNKPLFSTIMEIYQIPSILVTNYNYN